MQDRGVVYSLYQLVFRVSIRGEFSARHRNDRYVRSRISPRSLSGKGQLYPSRSQYGSVRWRDASVCDGLRGRRFSGEFHRDPTIGRAIFGKDRAIVGSGGVSYLLYGYYAVSRYGAGIYLFWYKDVIRAIANRAASVVGLL